jgi:ubiquitin-conjugating enzyme (huntingtin interacting protein 2)
MALRAITRQISIYNQGETTDVKAELVDDSPFHLHGSLQDPQDTYYEGDHFELDIVIPNDLSSAQSEVHHQGLPPEHLLRHRCYLR